MAYYSMQGIAHGRQDLLSCIKSFLTATVGWTLHDDLPAATQPYFVLKSFGESGMEDVYVSYGMSVTSGRLQVAVYQYWNATTHAAVNEASYASNTHIRVDDNGDFAYWIFADLDHVYIVTRLVSTYYGHYSGLLKRFWSGAVALTQSAIAAGANVTVPVNDAGILSPNKTFIIKDNAFIERVKVTAINTTVTPNTVTLENVVRAYAIGAKVGEDPQPLIVSYYYAPAGFYATNKFDGYQSTSGQEGRCGAAHGGLATDCDAEMRYGTTILFPWLASMSGSASYAELRGELIGIYALGGGSTAAEDTVEVGSEIFRVFNIYASGWCAVKER
jgi:hypothetical protein